MLNVLLVRIRPTDVLNYNKPDDFEFFSSENPQDFEVCVSNGKKLQFTQSPVYYVGSDLFSQKDNEMRESLDITYGAHTIVIDKYPGSQFIDGAKRGETGSSGIVRYEVEYRSEDFPYDSVILLVPDSEPIIIADLNFAYYKVTGSCSRFILLEKDAVLSFKSPFGEVIGISLKHSDKSALNPDSQFLSHTMSFEKVSLPAVILQKLLESKPQEESEPHEETHE